MIEYMLVAGVGGFFGTCGRYLTGIAAEKMFGAGFPFGTFCANVIGCFIIGVLFGLWDAHEMDAGMKALLISGFCGGYTTFSSFSHDAVELISGRKWGRFAVYVVLSLALGLLMVWLGMKCV